jgi:hypothetical protein
VNFIFEENTMRLFTSVAALAILAALSGCGSDAGAGANWIFYSYEESSSDGKTTTKYTVQEAINVKSVSHATLYPPKASDDKEKQALLWMMVAGKELKIYGPQAETIWKGLQKNN